MTSAAKKKDVRVYQIKVTLKGSRPPIWRRFQVTSDMTLRRLHLILQIVMGWIGYHLHMFIIDDVEYGEPEPMEDLTPIRSERRVKLGQVVKLENTKFTYEYDFGDGWEHALVVEKIMPPQEGVRYPVCLAGARACPPEDCGGIYGYADFLEAIRDPNHERHKELLEWVGGSFDPEEFDLDELNQELQETKCKPPFL